MRGRLSLVDRIGRYHVIDLVARGGSGAVYRALDPDSGAQVAVKLLLAGKDVTPLQRRRFATEIQTLLRVRHPNIVAPIDAGEHEGTPFVVLEWVAGETLATSLDRDGPWSPRESAGLVLKLAVALEACHRVEIIHRDIKPANVLLRARSREPVLTDFGLAKDLSAGEGSSTGGRTMRGRWLGTPGYWPPEQALGDVDAIGPRSDVYGLGALLYACLTGQPPQMAENVVQLIQMLEAPPTPPSEVRRGIPPGLDAICMKCMQRDPAARYPSAGAIAQAIEAWSLGGAPASSRRGRVAALLSGVVALPLLGAVIALATLEPAPPPPATVAAEPSTSRPSAAESKQAFLRALSAADEFPDGVRYRAALVRALELGREVLSSPEHRADAQLLLRRSLAALRVGRDADAASDFRRVTELDTSGPAGAEAAYRLLSMRLERAGALDPEGRAELARACLAWTPANSQAWGELLAALQAVLRDQNGQAALDCLTRAKALDESIAEVHALEGQLRLQLGQAEERVRAERALEQACSLDGHDAFTRFSLAKLHLAAGRIEQASREASCAVDLAPWLLPIRVMRAQLALLAGRTEVAVADVGSALEQAPEDPTSLRQLAQLLLAVPAGRDAEVDRLMARLEKLARDQPAPSLLRASRAIRAGRADEAVEQLLRARDFAPPDSRERDVLCDRVVEVAIAVERQGAIEERAAQVLATRPADPEALYTLSSLRLLLGLREAGANGAERIASARELLARGLAAHPGNRLLREGELLVEARTKERGDAALRAALERFEADFASDPVALCWLGKLLALGLGEPKSVEGVFRRAVRLSGDCTDAWGVSAHLAMVGRRHEEGLGYALRAFAGAGFVESQWLNLIGVMQAGLRRFDAAAESFEQSLAVDPLDGHSASSLASVLLETQRDGAAIVFCRDWLRMCSRVSVAPHPGVARALAEGLARQRDFTDAARVLEEAMAPSEDSELLVDLAGVYRQLGKLEQARELVERVLAKTPAHERAQKLRETLAR